MSENKIEYVYGLGDGGYAANVIHLSMGLVKIVGSGLKFDDGDASVKTHWWKHNNRWGGSYHVSR